MSPSYTSAAVGLVALIFSLTETTGQNSPCPNVFQYGLDNDGYYGIITIPAPGEGHTVVNISIAIYGNTRDSKKNGLKLLRNLEDTVRNAQRGEDVQYRFDFPQSNRMPIIQWITLNHQTICSEGIVNNVASWSFQHSFTYPSTAQYLSSPRKKPQPQQPPWSFFFNAGAQDGATPATNFVPNIIVPQPPPTTSTTERPKPKPTPPIILGPPAEPDDGSWISNYTFNRDCGSPALQQVTHTIIGGEETIEGEFPWIVAIFQRKDKNRWEYGCGGSLISNKHVLTAAHCTAKQNKVQLEIGRFNLDDEDELYEIRISQKIVEHPQYVPDTAHADIALIIISEITFTLKILPVCLWAFGTNLDSILRKGIISGWGVRENGGDRNDILLKLGVEKTTLDVCQQSDELFQRIATDKTFCAGGNYSGPCHGDSGSGFYIKNSKKWYLRGIISTSIGHRSLCNVSQYSVYADVAFFLDWLRSIIM